MSLDEETWKAEKMTLWRRWGMSFQNRTDGHGIDTTRKGRRRRRRGRRVCVCVTKVFI